MPRDAVYRYGNVLSAPQWLKDFLTLDMMDHFPAMLDAAQFKDQGGIVVTTTAVAAIGATSVAVSALPDIIPAGAILYFGAAGSNKYALLTAQANKGDTALTVEALPVALASGDKATYSVMGKKFIPSGTLLGRTNAERDAGTPFGPLASTDDEIGILLFDVIDAVLHPDCELLRPRRAVQIAENYLPGWTSVAGAVQTLIRANYNCIIGKD